MQKSVALIALLQLCLACESPKIISSASVEKANNYRGFYIEWELFEDIKASTLIQKNSNSDLIYFDSLAISKVSSVKENFLVSNTSCKWPVSKTYYNLIQHFKNQSSQYYHGFLQLELNTDQTIDLYETKLGRSYDSLDNFVFQRGPLLKSFSITSCKEGKWNATASDERIEFYFNNLNIVAVKHNEDFIETELSNSRISNGILYLGFNEATERLIDTNSFSFSGKYHQYMTRSVSGGESITEKITGTAITSLYPTKNTNRLLQNNIATTNKVSNVIIFDYLDGWDYSIFDSFILFKFPVSNNKYIFYMSHIITQHDGGNNTYDLKSVILDTNQNKPLYSFD